MSEHLLTDEQFSGLLELLGPFYRLIDDVVMNYSKNQKMDLFRILGKFVVIGSTVLGDLKTWENDNDLDFYLYEPDSKIREKDLRRVDGLIPDYVEQAVNLDLLPGLSTDKYTNDDYLSLTDYIFDVKKEVYTQRLGIMRTLTFEGFFITKLAAICDRDLETDYKALKVVYELFENKLPKEIQKTIQEFGLQKCYNKFKKHCF